MRHLWSSLCLSGQLILRSLTYLTSHEVLLLWDYLMKHVQLCLFCNIPVWCLVTNMPRTWVVSDEAWLQSCEWRVLYYTNTHAVHYLLEYFVCIRRLSEALSTMYIHIHTYVGMWMCITINFLCMQNHLGLCTTCVCVCMFCVCSV